MLTMQSSADYVADIEWSPWVSTIFASVTGDGFVCIWDMSISTLDPIVTEKILPRKPSCIKFSPNSNVVVSGDNTGRVQVCILCARHALWEPSQEKLVQVVCVYLLVPRALGSGT